VRLSDSLGATLAPCEQSVRVDQAELIPVGINGMEAALCTGANHDLACGLVMNLAFGKAAQCCCPSMYGTQVLDGEVDVIRVWRCSAIRGGDKRQDDWPTVKIVSTTSNRAPGRAKQRGVEACSVLGVRNLNCDAGNNWRLSARAGGDVLGIA
jgi:hypothetical protein